MSQKNLQYKQRLAALFTSFSVLLMGTASLTRTMSIDYYTVLCTLIKIIPACITMGMLGWVMGMILDQPKRRSGGAYGNYFINEIMKNNLSDSSNGEIKDSIAEGI